MKGVPGIDWRTHRILNRLVVAGIVIALVGSIAFPAHHLGRRFQLIFLLSQQNYRFMENIGQVLRE